MKLSYKYKVLLVDYTNLLYRGLFSHKHLSHRGEPTGGLYGFVRMLCTFTTRYECERLIICRDSKPYHRELVYPKYKKDRKEMDPSDLKLKLAAIQQVDSFLKLIGATSTVEKGWEADDIIGAYCQQRFRRFNKMFIASNDSDLYQLFEHSPNIFLCASKGLYGAVDFKADYDIAPYQWPRVLALTGTHNGVPGIKGVGPKTAVKLVKEGVTNEWLRKRYEVLPEEIKTRTELATAPFCGVDPPPKTDIPNPIVYDETAVKRFLDRYGIRMNAQFHTAFKSLARE